LLAVSIRLQLSMARPPALEGGWRNHRLERPQCRAVEASGEVERGVRMKVSPAQPPGWFHYGFLLFAAAFLYLNVFIMPATPIYDPLVVDQWFYLNNATRMLGGQMIYLDLRGKSSGCVP